MEGPVKGDFRLAKKPTQIGGIDIPAGAFLYIANSAAQLLARLNPAQLSGIGLPCGCIHDIRELMTLSELDRHTIDCVIRGLSSG